MHDQFAIISDWRPRNKVNDISLEENSIFQVRLSHIEDPSIIYVQPLQLIGYENEILIDLQNDINRFMSVENLKFLRENVKPSYYKVGELYIYFVSGIPYRVVIEKLWTEAPKAQILSVDTGRRKVIDLSDRNLVPLPPNSELTHSPFDTKFAVRISMGEIFPMESNGTWNPNCSKRIRKLYQNQVLIMYVTNPENGSAMLFHYNEQTDRLSNIADDLVRRHLARRFDNILGTQFFKK